MNISIDRSSAWFVVNDALARQSAALYDSRASHSSQSPEQAVWLYLTEPIRQQLDDDAQTIELPTWMAHICIIALGSRMDGYSDEQARRAVQIIRLIEGQIK